MKESSGLQFAGGSSTGLVGEWGWNLGLAKGPPSSPLQMPEDERIQSAADTRILLVEDNPGDVALVREAMKAQSLQQQLVIVRDGELAIRFIEDVDNRKVPGVDLVILDLNLPRRSGSDVLKRIRASTVCGNVCVMVLSSSNAERDRKEMAALGADRYVRKPSTLGELSELGMIVKEMLKKGDA
jgi:CheY-like chemotaxis protein